MSKLTKSVAYARALGRELQDARAGLVRFVPRLGLEIREVNANSFDGASRSSRSLVPRRRRCKQSRKLPPGSRLRFPPPHGGTAISRKNRAPSSGAPTGGSIGRNVLTPLIFVFERAPPFTR